MSQTISTTIGETYFITFNYGDRSVTSSQSIQLDVDGNSSLLNVELTSGIADNTLQSYTFTFVADSTSTTITLADTSANHSGVRGYLDDVAVRTDANPAPTIDYTENDPPVVINNSLLVNDLDDSLIEGATVQITGNYTNGEDLLNFTDQNNIVGTWDTNTGTLTLTGGASLADYTTALQTISYQNTSEAPDTSTRTISISITDGDTSSNVLTQAINVISTNDAPAGADKTINTNEDTDYVFTTSDFGFTDVESDTFLNVIIASAPSNGTLYVDSNGDGIVDTGETLSATDVVSIADINAGNLKFQPADNANGTGYDTFTFQVQDDGGVANGGIDTDQSPNTITIDVTAVNDAPIDLSANSVIHDIESNTITVIGSQTGTQSTSATLTSGRVVTVSVSSA